MSEGDELFADAVSLLLRRATLTVLVGGVLAAQAGSAAGQTSDLPPLPAQGCPTLYVLGVQGTGQSSPDSDPAEDSGLLSTVLVPLTSTVGTGRIAHAYVPYEAAFGGAVPGGSAPYSESVSGGLDRLRAMAIGVRAQCPRTSLAVIGYSQGAHIASQFAREVGQGAGAVPADSVAAVALLADPTRYPGASLFPGAPERSVPELPPGTGGSTVSAVDAGAVPVPPGGGIGPGRDIGPDYGALTGRVASLCLPGDLACDAPVDMPLLRLIVTIAGQVGYNLADPVATLTAIAQLAQTAAAKAATEIVNQDLSGVTLGTMRLDPNLRLSQRLADAADPRETPDARQALWKLATNAFNSLIAITGIALTPAALAEVFAAGSADPLAGLHCLAVKMVEASGQRLPRATGQRLLTETFDALAQLIAESGGLLEPAIWLRYLDTARHHGAYPLAAYTQDGRPAVRFISDWFGALALDLLAPRPQPTTTARPAPVATVAPQSTTNPPTTEPISPAPPERAPSDTAAPIEKTAHEANHRPLGHQQDRYLVGLQIFLSLCALAYFVPRMIARTPSRDNPRPRRTHRNRFVRRIIQGLRRMPPYS